MHADSVKSVWRAVTEQDQEQEEEGEEVMVVLQQSEIDTGSE